jgi:uncharacterized protein (TIGR02145 family)
LECTALAALLLLTACNVEESLLDNGTPPFEKGKLSFVLPIGKKSTTTYAVGDTVKGSDDEYKLVNLRIYWFINKGTGNTSADYGIHKIFGTGVGINTQIAEGIDQIQLNAVNATSPHATATIDVGDETTNSRFYFVANVCGATGSGLIESRMLRDLPNHPTLTAEVFEKYVSDSLLIDQQGLMVPIGTPLPMTVADNTYNPGGFVQVSNPAEQGIRDNVFLERRVARFDIINVADYSNFRVKNVIINNAQMQFTLHDSPFVWTTNVKNTTKINVEATANGAPASNPVDADLNGIPDCYEGSTKTDSTETVNESIFYLFPTVLDGKTGAGSSALTKTEISLEGIFSNTDQRFYKIDLKDTDKPIEANKVYRIRVVPRLNNVINLELTVADWESAALYDTVGASSPGKDITWGTFTANFKGVQLNDRYGMDSMVNKPYVFEYASTTTDSVKITIVSKGTNCSRDSVAGHHVTHAYIDKIDNTDYVQGDLDMTIGEINVKSKTVVTYAGIYETTHVITLPPTDAPLETELVMSNGINPQETRTLRLKSNNYAKTGIKPILIYNTDKNIKQLWAPVNVGATVLTKKDVDDFLPSFSADDNVTYTGYHFQWGRNLPFKGTATIPTVQGPVTAAAADTLTAFIKKGSANDYLITPDDSLWLGANAQGPCPDGWRVPTGDDWLYLSSISNDVSSSAAYSRWTLPKTSPTDTLWFPFNGYINSDGGLTKYNNASGETGMLWSASPDPVSSIVPKAPVRVQTKTRNVSGNETRANGMAVRAIRDLKY